MNQQTKKRIVVVGGGFAGVKLAMELGNDENFAITLISPHDQLEYHSALYRSATGRSPLEVVLPFREIFRHLPNVNLVNDYITELRAPTKEVKGQTGRVYSYDALILGIGYEIEYYGIKGAREHTETMYTIFDTIKLRNKMRAVFLRKQGENCRVVIIGAGPTGVELASDIATFATIIAETHSVPAVKPKVTIIDRAERLLPMLSDEVSKLASKRAKELGIKFTGSAVVGHCTPKHVCLANDDLLEADITVWTAGSRANSFFEKYPDIFTLDAKKRVIVNEFMQVNTPAVYVLGDAASTHYSGMAQTAISDAMQLAQNFKRFVKGEDLHKYRPHQPVYVVPMGNEWAVAQQGATVVAGSKAWKVRRDADFYALNSFLGEKLAREHWNKLHTIAQV